MSLFSTLRLLAALLMSYGLLLLANGLVTTLISLNIKAAGIEGAVLGLVVSAYYGGLFLGARHAAWVVHRVGHIRAFGVFASLMSMMPLLHSLYFNEWLWLALRVAAGFSQAGLIVVTESWLNARVNNRNRGTVLSIYMFINYLGAGLAQLLLMLDTPEGGRLFILASLIFSLSLVPVLLTRTDAPLPEPPGRLGLRSLWERAPVGLVGAVTAGLINASFYTLGPLFAALLGFSVEQISLFMALGILGGLTLQTPIGRLSDRIERRKVLAVMALLVALCCFGLVAAVQLETESRWLLGGAFLYGCLSFTLYSLSGAHANDWCESDRRMQTAAALLAGFGMGAVCGPLLAGVLISRLGAEGLFLFNGLVALLLSLFALAHVSRPRRGAKKPFIPQPSTQFSSEQLYRAAQQDGVVTPEEGEGKSRRE